MSPWAAPCLWVALCLWAAPSPWLARARLDALEEESRRHGRRERVGHPVILAGSPHPSERNRQHAERRVLRATPDLEAVVAAGHRPTTVALHAE